MAISRWYTGVLIDVQKLSEEVLPPGTLRLVSYCSKSVYALSIQTVSDLAFELGVLIRQFECVICDNMYHKDFVSALCARARYHFGFSQMYTWCVLSPK